MSSEVILACFRSVSSHRSYFEQYDKKTRRYVARHIYEAARHLCKPTEKPSLITATARERVIENMNNGVKSDKGVVDDHVYRPEVLAHLIIKHEFILDDFSLFSNLLNELSFTVKVLSSDNSGVLKKETRHSLTRHHYERAGLDLCVREGHFYKDAIPYGSTLLPVPDWMHELELLVGRT